VTVFSAPLFAAQASSVGRVLQIQVQRSKASSATESRSTDNIVFFEACLPSPTHRESTPLSADADDFVIQPPKNVLVKPVVLPAAVANASALCPRRCPHPSWPPCLYWSPNRRQTLSTNIPLILVLLPLLGAVPPDAPASLAGDPAGALEHDSEEFIKSDDSLLPHLRHDISFRLISI
jgi:hypothetical protein